MSDCHTVTTRVARKAHRCSECWGQIRKGESYAIESGIGDSEPFRYKMCGVCHPLFDSANRQAWRDNGEGLQYNGGLIEDVFESHGDPQRMRLFMANMLRRGSEVRAWMWKTWRKSMAAIEQEIDA